MFNIPQHGGCSCHVSLPQVPQSHWLLKCSLAVTRETDTARVDFVKRKKKEKKWVFPMKSCFQVTWDQPGCCVSPHRDGTIATLVVHQASPLSMASGHSEVPRGTTHVPRGRSRLTGQELDAGTESPLATSLRHHLRQVLVLWLSLARACCTPAPLLPFTVFHPPASALPLARGS